MHLRPLCPLPLPERQLTSASARRRSKNQKTPNRILVLMITTDPSIDISHDLTSLPGPGRSTQSDLDQPTNLPPCSQPPITDLSLSAFERRIAGASLPPPGPSHYTARRQLWLEKTGASPPPPVPSTSRQRLEQLLSMPGAATNDEVWKSGVERVWKGLVTGGRLKRRLPMTLVVRIV